MILKYCYIFAGLESGILTSFLAVDDEIRRPKDEDRTVRRAAVVQSSDQEFLKKVAMKYYDGVRRYAHEHSDHVDKSEIHAHVDCADENAGNNHLEQ